MAYPIASLPDGRILYSDGSKTWPMSRPDYGHVSTQSSGPTANKQMVIVPEMGNTSVNADILRSKFGFNDPNVINNILNNPAELERYARELNKPGGATQTPAPRTPLPQSSLNYTPAPQQSFNYTPIEPVERESGSSFSDKLKSFTENLYDSPFIKYNPFTQGVPRSATRQFLGNAVDAVSKFGWEQLNEGKPWEDTGISEFIAGGPTSNTGYAAEGSGVGSRVLGDKTAINIIPGSENMTLDPRGLMTPISDDMKNKDNYAKNLYDDAVKQSKNFAPTDVMPGGLGDIYAAIDPAYQEINNAYMQGQISEQEAQERLRKVEMDAVKLAYEKLQGSYDKLIPQYEDVATESIGEYEKNISKLREQGEEKKTETVNTYGEAIRRAVKNAQILENRRRNIFSNLGTAESSAFIEESGQASRELQKNLIDIERDQNKIVANIDKQIMEYETEANDEIAKIKKDKNDKIMAVKEAKGLSGKEEALEIAKINANFENALADIQNDYNMRKAGLIAMKANYAQNVGLINARGNVNQNLLKLQYGLERQAGRLAEQIPYELDNQLRGFLQAPQSSYANSARKSQLLAQFPEWADLIEEVFGGGINATSYDQLLGGGSTKSGLGQGLPDASYLPLNF